MEVHHSHHPSHKKKWTEYLLEFFMLFLAVFLGFIAENIRENIAEGHREKEYMKEIIQNLEYDKVRCNLNKQRNIVVILGLDSLRTELKNALHEKINPNALYYFSRYTTNISSAVFNTSAITELKNSGSLRLLSNTKLVDELSDYYERKVTATNKYLPVTTNALAQQNDIFSLLDLDDFIDAYDKMQTKTYDVDYNYQSILNRTPALTLLTTEPGILKKYYTQVGLLEISVKKYDFWLQYTYDAATKLIFNIKKEYHLQNE